MINIERSEGSYEIWIDPEGGFKDGMCIGCDKSWDDALLQALTELREAVRVVEKALHDGPGDPDAP